MLDQFTSSPDKHFMFTNGTHVESLFAQLQRWTEFLDFYVGHRIPHVPDLFRARAHDLRAGHRHLRPHAPARPLRRLHELREGARRVPGRARRPDPLRERLRRPVASRARRSRRSSTASRSGRRRRPCRPRGTSNPISSSRTKPPTIPDGDGRASTSYVYDPTAKPATDYSGSSSAIWGANPTYDWRPLPLGKALAFDSPPLTHDVTMVGTGSVDLWLRSTAPDTDLEVTLTELRPDGQERYVQSGWLRASHRKLDPKTRPRCGRGTPTCRPTPRRCPPASS